MDQAQDISNKIVQLISEAPEGVMLGVRLGASLRSYFPNFQPFVYRCRNLRQFIATYVPAVSEKGRSGADIIYTTAEELVPVSFAIHPVTPPPASAVLEHEPLPTNPFNWKAYSNPGHPFVVAANRDTGALQVFPQASNIFTPWIVLPKPTTESHAEIANEFASSLPEPSRTNLRALLHDPKWYVRFSGVAMRNGLGPKWAAFRRNKLIERFNASLRELAIPQISHSPQKVATSWKIPPSTTSSSISIAPAEDSEFRNMLHKVLSELPLSELRSLRLPVGVVFDILKR